MEPSDSVTRRGFARTALVGLSALLVDSRTVFSAWEPAKRRSPLSSLGGDGATMIAPCVPTEPMEIGPYHRDGAPWRTALCDPTEPGRKLQVEGQVLAADGCRPLSDVLIDVWQADAAGHYDFQDKPLTSTPLGYRMRAQLLSDAQGRFAFSSVIPGNYGSKPTEQRAKHVHYLVQRTGYEPLITQMYFSGDPWNARDPLVRQSLIRPIMDVSRTQARVGFDIVLSRERPVDRATLRTMGEFIGDYTSPAMHGDTIRVEWRNGQLVAVFGKSDIAQLRPDSATRMFAREWAARLTFIRDEHGKVAELLGELDDGRKSRLKKVR